MVVAITGHRPTGLWGYQPNPKYTLLRQDLSRRFEALIQQRQVSRFLFGMALGADSIAFDVCLKLREKHQIELIAVVPYAQFPNRWERGQYERYRQRVEVADEVVHVDTLREYEVWDVPVGFHHNQKLLSRNQYLVDHADLVFAIWSGVERGGTYDTVCRARKAGKELIVYNPFEACGR